MEQQQTPKTAYIDLRALNNAFVHNITSAATKITKRCICIPIDDNFIVESSYVSKRTGKEVRTAIAAVKMWPVTDEDRAAAREKGIELQPPPRHQRQGSQRPPATRPRPRRPPQLPHRRLRPRTRQSPPPLHRHRLRPPPPRTPSRTSPHTRNLNARRQRRPPILSACPHRAINEQEHFYSQHKFKSQ